MRISDWSSDVCSSDLAHRSVVRRSRRPPQNWTVCSEVSWRGLGGAACCAQQGRADAIRVWLAPAGCNVLVGSDQVAGVLDGVITPSQCHLPVDYAKVILGCAMLLCRRKDRKSVVEGKSVSVRRDLGGG